MYVYVAPLLTDGGVMELYALTMPPNVVCYDNHPLAPLSVLGGACLGAHYFPLLPCLALQRTQGSR